MRTTLNNSELLQLATKVTPGGSQTYSKSYRYFCGDNPPLFLDRGKGAQVWDVEDREYTDFLLALGPVTVGYVNDEINEAIRQQLDKGISFSLATKLEVDLACKLIEIIPCAEMVRFVKNGSDATTAAIRLARAFTEKEHVAVCGYHGMQDWYIGTTSLNRGVPNVVSEMSHVFQYNDISSLEKIFDQTNNQVAAVILEPVQGTNPNSEFLKEVKGLCERKGALLVFDEVISGFRVALGGAQELYGVTPDLSSFGKGMANGMPLSAVVGRSDVVRLIDEGVFVSTTFGGEALSLAASLKTIEILKRPGSFEHIWECSSLWRDAIQDALVYLDLEDHITFFGAAPHSGILFSDVSDSVTSLDICSFFQAHLLRNTLLSTGVNNFCLAHTREDVERLNRVTIEGLEILKDAYHGGIFEYSGPRVNPILKRN